MLPLITRFILYFAGSALAVILALASFEYQKFELEKSQFQAEEALRLSLTSRELQADLREPVRDISTIAALQVLGDYLGNETAANRIRVETVFRNFAQNARIYDQIRYIDRSGMERVRVNYHDGVAAAAPLDQLQDKSQRYYFIESRRLKPNAIYISHVDLNVEQGEIERPFKPMIRIAAPVYDAAGQLKGIVMLNYLAAAMLDDFRKFMEDSWGEPMMVNPGGYWLASPYRDDEWGFMFGREVTFGKRYPGAWNYIVSNAAGAVKTENDLFIFDTIHPYAVSAIRGTTPAEKIVTEQYWKIITRIPQQALIYSPLSLIEARTTALASLLSLVFVLSVALAWLRTNYVAKVNALRESENRLAEAQRIAHVGNWVWDIPTGKLTWSDEIYRIFGREPEPFGASYDAFLAAIHPDDRERVVGAVNAAVRRKAPYAIDHRVVLPDGAVRYVHERGAVQLNAAGESVRMHGTVQDVTERIQTEEVLRENEERFRQLADNINEVFWLAEWPQNKVLYVSPAFERVWGINAGQLYEDPMVWVRAVADKDRQRVEQAYLDGAGKGGFDVTYQIIRPDGESRWMHDRAFEVRNKEGAVFRIAGVAQDITERKQAEQALRESEERFRLLFESVAEGVFGVDLKGDCMFINPAGLRILGYTDAAQLIGKPIHQLIHHTRPDGSSCPQQECRVYRAFRENQNFYSDNEWFWRSDGSFFEVEYRSHPLRRDGKAVGSVTTFVDISERKRAEQQLQNYREQLEAMVAQRTAELEASYKEMEAFSYSIAHDLRTPLRSITSFSQILEQEAGPKLSEQELLDLRRIIKAGKYMAALIDDILELARISRTQFALETVDLSGLANTIVENFRRVDPRRSVRVDIAPNMKCKGDIRLLRIALENLFENAWKYTRKRADAHIEFGVTKKDHEKVYYVRDNGAGFDMRYIHKLFTPFGRLHKPDEFEGAGIGLVSVQSAIQRHNGRVWVESKEGEGSTFYFTLGVFQSNKQNVPELAAPGNHHGGAKQRAKESVI
ncbi:MAG: PAS domain S-box protein [Gammaproteobacteria bacterium]|nr:PAS domain S-box protein [Gammaproteobacteria bacterium]